MGISIDEKRVYDASEGPRPVYVVGEFGVARVDTSDDLVGEFGLARECSARDAAGSDGRVAVATDEDVLVGTAGEDDTEFEALGVGPAVAVGFSDGDLLVAHEDGRIECGDSHDWTTLGELDDVRAIDGDFLAAESGVYRVTGTSLRHVGLDDARAVAARGAPRAATADGLYRLGNGWLDELEGEFRAVSAGERSAGGSVEESTEGVAGIPEWAHAARADGRLLAREDRGADGVEWHEVELPVDGEVIALDHGETDPTGAYAVTEDGTFLLSVGDGWNYQILGLRGVRGVAAP
ncbi:HVO_0234 family beta-propeller protein [Halorussus litoreus]|uniref:HVO_0234 family beta-propeller protein n=1 Tax=Halorussus litoreus TaxID=1710536 RepID=UPI000E22660D|nr:hypothetical protein [Halorussus litoreus]